jgi:SAM-dependent methyltransferase
MFKKQVDKSHYEFKKYMSKQRWNSVWHQLNEIQKLEPKSVLEIGPGLGVLKIVAAQFGVKVETMDIDPELKPDHVASATNMPFQDSSYDVTCAFQMLEHLPYEHALKAFQEMVRVSKRYIVISLPDAERVWRFTAELPKLGIKEFFLKRPRFRKPIHEFDGEHYWEINKRGYELEKIIKDFSQVAKLINKYRVSEYSYHHFFVFEK